MLTDEKIDKLFDNLKEWFIQWVKAKPTGEFNINIPVHEGGIRERYTIGTKEKQKVGL